MVKEGEPYASTTEEAQATTEPVTALPLSRIDASPLRIWLIDLWSH